METKAIFVLIFKIEVCGRSTIASEAPAPHTYRFMDLVHGAMGMLKPTLRLNWKKVGVSGLQNSSAVSFKAELN